MHQDIEGGEGTLFGEKCGEFSDWNKEVIFPLESKQ